MTKLQIQQRFINMKMNEVSNEEIVQLAFPKPPAFIAYHKKHPKLMKMLCSCGCYSSEYGHKFPKPIRHENGDIECPHCHKIVENTGNTMGSWFSLYHMEDRTVTVFENHDGCDFVRIFEVRWYWWKDMKEPNVTVCEIVRYIYDENMNFYAMRRSRYSMNYRMSYRFDTDLKFFWDWKRKTYYYSASYYDYSTYGSMGSLSKRFDNMHITDTEMATSSWLRDWIEHYQQPDFDHRLETVLVKGENAMLSYFLNWNSFKVVYWPQCKMAMKRGYKVSDMWFDELKTLEYLGIDITNADNIFPKDLEEAHILHNRQAQKKREAEWQEERIKKALEKVGQEEKKYAKAMKKKALLFANSRITAPGLTLTPLTTVREYAEEGSAMSHCLYTSEYYAVSDYLVLSAQNEFGQRLETVTISCKDRKIVASLGKNNKYSSYHERIKYAVNKAMPTLLKGQPYEIKEWPEEVLRAEFPKEVLAQQNNLPSIFNYHDENAHFDDIRFKKAYQADGNEVIIALKVYGDTEETFLFTDQDNSDAFRVTKARVIGIYDVDGRLTDMKEANSYHNRDYAYQVGEDCKPENPGEQTSGIYCFNTFVGAVNYWKNLEVKMTRAAA